MSKSVARIGFLLAAFAILGQYYLALERAPQDQLSWLGATARYFSFMTVWTNVLVAITFLAAAFPAPARLDFFRSRSVQAATSAFILMVGLAYHILLASRFQQTGLNWWTNLLLHYINPLLYCSWWLFMAEKEALGFRAALNWMLFPIAYFIYSLIRGELIGWYPYFFVDVNTLGYPQVLTTSAILLAIYLSFGLLVIWLSRLTSKASAV